MKTDTDASISHNALIVSPRSSATAPRQQAPTTASTTHTGYAHSGQYAPARINLFLSPSVRGMR